jgi:O-antigen ligase
MSYQHSVAAHPSYWPSPRTDRARPVGEPPGGAARPERRTSAVTAPEPWDLLLICVAAYIFTAVGRIHQLFPVLEVLHPAMLVGGGALAAYLADRRYVRALRWTWSRPMRWLLGLLIWMVLTVPTAIVHGNSFDMAINNFAKTVAMSFVIVASARSTRDVERLAFVYVVAAAVYAAVVLTRFDLGTGSDWRLGDLYYYDANDFATYIVTALPLGLYVLHTSRRVGMRALTAAALMLLMIVFLRTGSRGGFIALLAAGVFVVLRYSAIAFRYRIGGTVLAAIVIVGAAGDRYWAQMTTIVDNEDYNRTEETGRLQIWQRGIGYMLHRPVWGLGAANFQTAEGTLSPMAAQEQFGRGVKWNAPHNSYVQAGAELGVPGLALLLAVIVSTFQTLRRIMRRAGEDTAPELAQALTASLIGFAVGAFFLSLAYGEMLYTLVALAVALSKTSLVNPARRLGTA